MIRKVEANQADTISKTSDPGNIKVERTWTKWEIKFENYISTIPGVNGVPLSYVVRYQAAPDHTTDFQGNFTSEAIACTPLI